MTNCRSGGWCLQMAATKHCESALDLLLKKYNLKIEDVCKKISGEHLDRISHSYCSKWRRLLPYFNMEKIVEDDIDQLSVNGEEKRSKFFKKWEEVKGSSATYEKLVSALLKMECRNDAEKVCELIQPASDRRPRPEHKTGPQLPQPASDNTSPQGRTN